MTNDAEIQGLWKEASARHAEQNIALGAAGEDKDSLSALLVTECHATADIAIENRERVLIMSDQIEALPDRIGEVVKANGNGGKGSRFTVPRKNGGKPYIDISGPAADMITRAVALVVVVGSLLGGIWYLRAQQDKGFESLQSRFPPATATGSAAIFE